MNSFYDEESGKYGFKDRFNRIIITPQYDLARGFSENDIYSYVCKDGKYIFIDRLNNNPITEVFLDIDYSSFKDGCAIVKKDDGWFVMSLQGKLIYGPCYNIRRSNNTGFLLIKPLILNANGLITLSNPIFSLLTNLWLTLMNMLF